jgi:gliding motility-associated-like protein
MNRLNRPNRISRPNLLTRGALLLCVALFSFIAGDAFQSVKVETISAFVMTGGGSGGGGESLRIQHLPLESISDITHQTIIFTQVGNEIPPGNPSFNARLNPTSNFGSLANRVVRVRVFYRVFDPAGSGTPPPPSETPVVEGPDPLAAAFEIPSAQLTERVLQYKIVAERILYQGSQLIVLSTVTLPAPSASEPDPYFSVGIQANAAQIMNESGGHFAINDGNPADGETSIDIPAGLLKTQTTVTIDELPVNSPVVPGGLNQPIKIYRFDTDPQVNGLMSIKLLYPDFEFPQGQDGLVDGTQIPEQNLSVVWWDGFRWRPISRGVGELSAQSINDNVIRLNVGSLGFFAIVAGAGPLDAQDRRPSEKVITPNGDGIADVVNFTFGDRSDNIKVDIFDSTGHRMRTLMSQTTLQWDGRDESGSVVESGVYIYQYTIDGTRISGLIAVAK